ncbi:HSF-type DNA-binding-domain-containing protein [Mycotypha africana]|uniref:HSF-type DNA-binding-domain-containing protein n=1 Tax=Mycotypha africana TaxID=64632 RepID=UPI002301043C|nr:HSF-type DNA-binding-domain-containing protein [Mycotypha africana]KAI8984415.1 HSF-type DNA-binding-domain-containing protein [Mycotypha africana]
MNIFHGRDSSLSSISGSFMDSSCSISTSGDGSPGISPISSPYLSPGGSGVGGRFLGSNDSPQYYISTNSNNNTSTSSLQLPSTKAQTIATTTSSIDNNNNNTKSSNPGNTTFVHKLYNMVVDNQYQYLIAWNYTGTSFIVCNITEFSKEVLPKHFKHSNFSSFVRQLNMYGFHKVNKSPRGHKTLAQNQIWEFSHSKFIKERRDLLDDIKRKSIENHTNNSSSNNTDNNGVTKKQQQQPYAHNNIGSNCGSVSSTNSCNPALLGYHDNNHVQCYSIPDYRQQQQQQDMLTMIQISQIEMVKKIAQLQENFNLIVNELAETKDTQVKQQQVLQNMINFLTSRHRNDDQHYHQQQLSNGMMIVETPPPSIFVTSHDSATTSTTTTTSNAPSHLNQRRNQPPPPPILTDNLSPMMMTASSQQASPALSAYHTALNTPVSPLNSPDPFIMMSDENIQIPDLPNTTSNSVNSLTFAFNNTNIGNSSNTHHSFYTTQQQQQQQFVIYHNSPSTALPNNINDKMIIDQPIITGTDTTTTTTTTPTTNYNKFLMHPQQQQFNPMFKMEP